MRELLPFLALFRRHPWRIAGGIILALVTLLASIALLSISGWFLAATALAGFASLYTFNYLMPAGGVRVSAILCTAARYAERLVSHDATFRVLTHLRIFTFKRLLPLTPGAIQRFRQADLLNRLVADIDTLDHLYLRLLSPQICALVIIAVVTAGLNLLSSTLALTLGAIMLGLLILLPWSFYHAGKGIGRDLTLLRSQYRVQLAGWLQGQAELVIFGALSRFRQALDSTESQWLRRQQQQNHLSALSQSLMILASGLTATLMLWLAAGLFTGSSSAGALVALVVFVTLAAFEALGPVAAAYQHLGHVITSAQRVSQMLNQSPAVSFVEDATAQSAQTNSAASVHIEDLSFTYPGQAHAVLQQISLNISAGEHVALLGHTGCGKSTLLQLLTRAWDPQGGEIRLNQQPLRQYSENALRQMMSVVPQRIHAFSATLRDNLQLAAPEASDQQLSAALHQVGLDNLLQGEGLNAWLGEGGRQLSGGELRRLGIARALLHSAPVLLLDEPTEGLDSATEQQILHLLTGLGREKTLLVVTHRLTG
ncbi:MAG: heme ABC transporter ATP-binding protein/permease CydC, partial [Enterobacteriaceae bacterium]